MGEGFSAAQAIYDFLFGKKALDKAAGPPTSNVSSNPAPGSVGVSQSDIAKMAEEDAARAKAKTTPPKTADKLSRQFLDQ